MQITKGKCRIQFTKVKSQKLTPECKQQKANPIETLQNSLAFYTDV